MVLWFLALASVTKASGSICSAACLAARAADVTPAAATPQLLDPPAEAKASAVVGLVGVCWAMVLAAAAKAASADFAATVLAVAPTAAVLLALAAERVLESVVLPAGSTPVVQQLLVLLAELKGVSLALLASVLCWTWFARWKPRRRRCSPAC
ncbi:MAG: hypothetical protein ACKN9U_06095 [Pirellulaceae bacterium]